MKENDDKCIRALNAVKIFRPIISSSVFVSRKAYTLSIVEESSIVLGQEHNDAINVRIFSVRSG